MVLLVESHQGGKEVAGTSTLHSSYKTYEALAHTTFTKIFNIYGKYIVTKTSYVWMKAYRRNAQQYPAPITGKREGIHWL